MSDVTTEQMLDVFRAAQERAGTVVENWIPEEEGDNLAGRIVERATITTDYGEVRVTTHAVFNHDKIADGSLFRVAWMGAVLKAKAERYDPDIDDFCAFNYQSTIQPKKAGYKPYKMIESVILDGKNGYKPKDPVNWDIQEVTTFVDPETGEIPDAMTAEEFAAKFRENAGSNAATEGPREGEKAF